MNRSNYGRVAEAVLLALLAAAPAARAFDEKPAEKTAAQKDEAGVGAGGPPVTGVIPGVRNMSINRLEFTEFAAGNGRDRS